MATQTFSSASLYVGNLDLETTEAVLFDAFNAVAPVASVRICRDAATRRSLGYGYVNLHRVEDSERALELLNHKQIGSNPCRVMRSQRDPAFRKSGVGNLFIKNLAKNIDEKQLHDTFSSFGHILSCKVATDPKRQSRGYGFVHYESVESAQKAIDSVHGKLIGGNAVTVTHFKSKEERGGGLTRFTNLFIKNLPADMTEAKFIELFTPYGVISSSKFAVNETGHPKGFGFVNYQTTEQAHAALQALNGSAIGDATLYVGRAQKKAEREAELRLRFDKIRLERQKAHHGVNLYVKNLADDMDDDRLRREFSQFGAITSCLIMRDGLKSRGFGFVCFSTPEEATRAVTAMNNRMFDHKPLFVAIAQSKEERRAMLEAQRARRQQVPQPYPQPGYYPQQFMRPPELQWAAQLHPRGPPQTAGRLVHPSQSRGGSGARAAQRRAYQLYPQQASTQAYQQAPTQAYPQAPTQAYPPQAYPLMQQPQLQAHPLMQPQPHHQAHSQAHPQAHPQAHAQPHAQVQPQVHPQQTQVNPQTQAPVQAVSATPAVIPPTIVADDSFVGMLARATPLQKKQLIGEHLYPLVFRVQPELAGKITGMLLEMNDTELLHLIDNEPARTEKIREAVDVLHQHQRQAMTLQQ